MKKISGWLRLSGALGIAGAVLLGSNQAAAELLAFKDLPATHWAYDTVMWSKSNGISDGYPDGTFRPSNAVTESEFLVMLLRAYPEIQLEDKQEGEAWYAPYYRYAEEMYWTVYNEPSKPITRGQAAELMIGVTNELLTETESIQWLLDKGIAQGKTGPGVDGFARQDVLSRAEAQTFLYRLKQHVPKVTSPDLIQPEIELQGISIGDSESQVISLMGEPDRKDQLNSKMEWYIYNRDYSKYAQVGIMDKKVIALFSNGTGWNFGDTSYDKGLADLKSQADALWGDNKLVDDNVVYYLPRGLQIKLFTDAHEDGRVDGVYVTSNNSFDYVFEMEITEDTLKSYELEILDLTNTFRVSKGLQALTWNDQAAEAARLHSADMAKRSFFDHTNPDGKSPGDRMAAQGLISYQTWGENIAAGYTNAIDAHYGWVNSLGNRKNLLNSNFTWLGVGVKALMDDSEFGIYYTQNFYTPR
ncbi:Cysteine-rich secretory protein family protein [compost metagenome]